MERWESIVEAAMNRLTGANMAIDLATPCAIFLFQSQPDRPDAWEEILNYGLPVSPWAISIALS